MWEKCCRKSKQLHEQQVGKIQKQSQRCTNPPKQMQQLHFKWTQQKLYCKRATDSCSYWKRIWPDFIKEYMHVHVAAALPLCRLHMQCFSVQVCVFLNLHCWCICNMSLMYLFWLSTAISFLSFEACFSCMFFNCFLWKCLEPLQPLPSSASNEKASNSELLLVTTVHSCCIRCQKCVKNITP